MKTKLSNIQKPIGKTLILRGTGKTGRCVAERL